MTDSVKLLLVVAAVVLDGEGRVLLAQRPQGKNLAGLWEFPGGKIEAGERPEDALVRELHEELDIEVAVSDLTPIAFASHAYADFHLLMPLWKTHVWQGTPRSKEGQNLAQRPWGIAMIKKTRLKQRNQRGATAIEYGLIAALMVLAMIPALEALGGSTNGMFTTVTNKIVTAVNNAR
jgi:8-oxo-dGTP diphosphatase